VCGRTARTVRRAGTAKAVSDPYRTMDSTLRCQLRMNSASRVRRANRVDECIEEPSLFGGKTHKRRQQRGAIG
jgi:hypothetical protein